MRTGTLPAQRDIEDLWRVCHLPDRKKVHCRLVADVFAASLWSAHGIPIRRDLLRACALLHDIDKHIPSLYGERHPDTGVRLLRQEG